ncbi:TspO/MBR family protein [Carnobacterium sp.]|uniref:TspO/MBR family protein n=1 Tax=Carnobacterium sp. TaxID=48221 RepID=UPI0028AA1947|nr:TspO/MBR family protein [Carnobacterium sp.]
MKTASKTWVNAIVLVIVLAINYISSTGMINNTDQKEMSDKYLTPITPAPFTFGIWGVIYTLVFISIIILILNRNKESYKRTIDTLSPLFWLSSLFNVGWIITFLYDKVLVSTVLILALTVVLAVINRLIVKINDNRKNILSLTFGLYNGWLLIATIVNIAAYLEKINWKRGGLSEETWGIVLLSTALVIALLMMILLKNAAFTLPAAWACFGIYKFLTSPEGFDNLYSRLPIISIVFSVILVISALAQFRTNKWKVVPVPKHNFHYRKGMNSL